MDGKQWTRNKSISLDDKFWMPSRCSEAAVAGNSCHGLGEHFLPGPPRRIEDELRHCGELCDLRKNHCFWGKIIRSCSSSSSSSSVQILEHVKEGCVLVIMATPSNFYKNSVHAYARELDLSSVLENLHGRLPLQFRLSWDKFCMRNVCQSGQGCRWSQLRV